MNDELLKQSNSLHTEMHHMAGFIRAIPTHKTANCLVAIKVLYEDYHDTAIEYLNSDLFNLLQQAKKLAEGHLERLKRQFEGLK